MKKLNNHTPLPWILCRGTLNKETQTFHFASNKLGSRSPIIECNDYHCYDAAEMDANAVFIDTAVHNYYDDKKEIEQLRNTLKGVLNRFLIIKETHSDLCLDADIENIKAALGMF